jgi:hypothetical protein
MVLSFLGCLLLFFYRRALSVCSKQLHTWKYAENIIFHLSIFSLPDINLSQLCHGLVVLCYFLQSR